MEQVIVSENVNVLIPNSDHKNFTKGAKVIPQGTTLNGELILINGLRRGAPFQYRLFKIANKNEYIYQKSINQIKNNMETTEVKLGAGGDSVVSPTVVTVPSNQKADKTPYIGAVVGAVVGFGVAKYRKVEGNKKWIYVGVGAVVGVLAGKMYAKKKNVTVKLPK